MPYIKELKDIIPFEYENFDNKIIPQYKMRNEPVDYPCLEMDEKICFSSNNYFDSMKQYI